MNSKKEANIMNVKCASRGANFIRYQREASKYSARFVLEINTDTVACLL
jgi:hypothetical protein